MQNTELPENSRSFQIQSLLSRAAQLPAGERDVFLSRECGGDEALRAQVYELLLEESRGIARKKLSARPGPVTSAVQQALSGTAQDRRVELLGKVVGDYKLVAIVGVGGVGTVVPALLTSASRRPKCSLITSSMLRTAWSSLTSACRTRVAAPASSASCAVVLALASLML